MSESTLREYLESQEDLVREAGLALPHSFSHCTYPLGHLRQAVYLCTTCPEARGICSACSIACHTQHEQVELFPKRNFRCDCCTTSIAHRCTLETTFHPPNTANEYGQNFQALFCRCSRTYDAQKEREAMIQCLSCEDWFHESCCNLRERPDSREPTPEAEAPKQDVSIATDDEAHENADADSEASFNGLPPPLISAADYDSFVCGACVSKIPLLRRYAGTPGVIMVVRDTAESTWRRIGDPVNDERDSVSVTDQAGSANAGMKRRLSPSGEIEAAPEAKRSRRPSDEGGSTSSTSSKPCLAPTPNSVASRIYQQLSCGVSESGTGDVFLTDGFRERWCRCEDCLVSLENHRYLMEEEETYEPPEDPDSGLSLEELGMRALARLPRDRAIDGIHAFNKMKDGLKSFLQPFADEGKVVNEADVRDFFTSLTEAAKQGH